MRRDFDDRRSWSDRGMRSEERGRFDRGNVNWGSARSDYGDRAYGGRLNDEGRERGWFDRAADEVSGWFGGERGGERRMDDRYRNRRGYEGEDRGRRYNEGRQGGTQYGWFGMQGRERDWHDLRAGDLMTRDVSTVHPNDPIRRAARLMRDEDCGALPVTDREGRMIGMITDRDIAVRMVADGYETRNTRVSDCMTEEVFACHVNDRIDGCMRTMADHQIRRVPVLNDRGRVLGIISQADVARHAAEHESRGERRRVSEVIGTISEPTDEAYS